MDEIEETVYEYVCRRLLYDAWFGLPFTTKKDEDEDEDEDNETKYLND